VKSDSAVEVCFSSRVNLQLLQLASSQREASRFLKLVYFQRVCSFYVFLLFSIIPNHDWMDEYAL
jgi:hypothetical protein